MNILKRGRIENRLVLVAVMVGGIRPGRETRGEKPQPLEYHAHQHQSELRRAHQCLFSFPYGQRKGHRRDGGSRRGSTRHAYFTR